MKIKTSELTGAALDWIVAKCEGRVLTEPKPASTAAILLREHDNVEQAIAYAERMAQRYADSRNMMALDYQNAAKELKEWKRNKPRCTTN